MVNLWADEQKRHIRPNLFALFNTAVRGVR